MSLMLAVMGDTETGLYVAADVVPVYRSMLHLADIITPNHFELELLAECTVTIQNLDTVLDTLRQRYRIPNIVITSMPTPDGLLCISSSPSEKKIYTVTQIEGYFSGVGDLFSAMILARYQGDLSLAVGQALNTVQNILKSTDAGIDMASRELRIVQNPHFITDTSTY